MLRLLLVAGCLLSLASIHADETPPPAEAVAFGGHHYLLKDEVADLSWDSTVFVEF